MALILHLLLFIIALPVTAATLYLGLLTLLSARLPRPQPRRRDMRFDILVPAHNETAVIERTVRSLAAIDWPREHYRIVVIADNCSDDTAALARAAGAEVIERHDPAQRGKGYALEFGIAHSAADGFAQAVAVIDADTEVTPNLLATCAARIEQGAEVMQVHYGVLNPDDSWRTRIITIAYGAFHAVRGRARERLHASNGLRGNGMCMTHALLRDVPFNIHSMTEDLEYGIVLGLAGRRVVYIDEASADAELVASERGSRTQRQRWEGGRLAVLKAYVGRLLRQGLSRPSWLCLELAIDLLTLPLGYIVLQTGGLLALGGLAALALPDAGLAIWPLLALGLLPCWPCMCCAAGSSRRWGRAPCWTCCARPSSCCGSWWCCCATGATGTGSRPTGIPDEAAPCIGLGPGAPVRQLDRRPGHAVGGQFRRRPDPDPLCGRNPIRLLHPGLQHHDVAHDLAGDLHRHADGDPPARAGRAAAAPMDGQPVARPEAAGPVGRAAGPGRDIGRLGGGPVRRRIGRRGGRGPGPGAGGAVSRVSARHSADVSPSAAGAGADAVYVAVLLAACALAVHAPAPGDLPQSFLSDLRSAALLAGATPYYVNADPARNFACDWATVPEDVWKRAQLVFVCSPGNPAGNVMSLEDWRVLFELSDRHGFVIASDECYSEIYFDQAPLGSLQAARRLGRDDYRNVVAFSSLSKRSNVPGMRSGFVAGDARLIGRFLLYRTYHAAP